MLRIPAYEHQNAKLMFFLVLVVQLSDILQYVWGKSIGNRRIAPSISPNKTWAGLVGGTVSANDGRFASLSPSLTRFGYAARQSMAAWRRSR